MIERDAMVAALAERLWGMDFADPEATRLAKRILGERGEFYSDGAPLSHGLSPRPSWAGTCPDCGAEAGTDCAVLTHPDSLDVERLARAITQVLGDEVSLHRTAAERIAREYAAAPRSET